MSRMKVQTGCRIPDRAAAANRITADGYTGAKGFRHAADVRVSAITNPNWRGRSFNAVRVFTGST